MTSGSFRSVSRPRNRRKSQSARLRVLASQSKVALDRSETFLRNQDPKRTFALGALQHRDAGAGILAAYFQTILIAPSSCVPDAKDGYPARWRHPAPTTA